MTAVTQEITRQVTATLRCVKCDNCSEVKPLREDLRPSIPPGWIHYVQSPAQDDFGDERHFCSRVCLEAWLS